MSDSPPIARPQGYHDFAGLAGLRGDVARGDKGAIRQTAEQFEAYFLQEVMKSMRAAVEKSDLLDDSHSDTFQDMMDKEIAVKMASRSATGLADMIERQLTRPTETTAHQALTAREKAWPPQQEGSSLPLHPAAVGLPAPERAGAPRAFPIKPAARGAGVTE